ncbi:MAG: flagellar filament capping protein FliD [Syntrophobacteraceae bacterium]
MSSVSSTGSSSSTLSELGLTGMGTNIDWQGMLTQLQAVSEKSLTPYTNQITTCNDEVSAWQTLDGDLNTLQTASNALTTSGTGLDQYSATVTSSSSVSASSLLSASASSSASNGSYNVVINNVAQSEKLASGSFASETSALGLSGTILVNGHAVQIAATDTLQDLESNINNADTGTQASAVTASIFQTSSTGYRLVLTSNNTGATGISLLNGSSSDTLGSLGFNTTETSIKNPITGGAESDAFGSTSTSVEAMLGNENNDLSGTVTINGISATIDLTDSLSTIQTNLAAAGISASIVSSTSGSQTTYRLAIAGMTDSNYTDQNNVLQALGLIQGNGVDESEVTGTVANTTDGSTPITASTPITSIYGYNNYTSGDKITISGTATDGTAVAATSFDIAQSSTTGEVYTVGDLLNEIDSLFGNVTASVTSNGQIQVIDNATGTSDLSVNLATSVADSNSQLSFGSFGQVLQQGTDAAFSVDGMSMTSSTNTVTNAIAGVTLKLLGSDPNTTLTLNVSPDTQAIENNVNTWINAYNTVMSYINTQNTYTASSNTTGGPLFGNNTLESIKSQLQSTITDQVGTGSMDYLADIGITAGANGQLSLNTTTFEQSLSSNFSGVVNLLSDSGTSSNSQFQYVGNSSNTQSGPYNVYISQLPGTGQSIEGTIDGLEASGSGNMLTLNNTASGADGLEVSYTGTTAQTSATITVNRGIASLINGLVSGFTSTNGTVAAETTGLQNSITGLNKQVSTMQSNINQQMSTLQTEFENMDVVVARMDEMQSYLTAQLANL